MFKYDGMTHSISLGFLMVCSLPYREKVLHSKVRFFNAAIVATSHGYPYKIAQSHVHPTELRQDSIIESAKEGE